MDMATLLLSTVIWVFRTWKHEALATFEIFFSYVMYVYMFNLSNLFFSTHIGNIMAPVLGPIIHIMFFFLKKQIRT